jgi:hypothetical protein
LFSTPGILARRVQYFRAIFEFRNIRISIRTVQCDAPDTW